MSPRPARAGHRTILTTLSCGFGSWAPAQVTATRRTESPRAPSRPASAPRPRRRAHGHAGCPGPAVGGPGATTCPDRACRERGRHPATSPVPCGAGCCRCHRCRQLPRAGLPRARTAATAADRPVGRGGRWFIGALGRCASGTPASGLVWRGLGSATVPQSASRADWPARRTTDDWGVDLPCTLNQIV